MPCAAEGFLYRKEQRICFVIQGPIFTFEVKVNEKDLPTYFSIVPTTTSFTMESNSKLQRKLKITLVQSDILWESPAQNRIRYEQMLRSEKQTDLIIFPEMFTTGFGMSPEKLKESMVGETISWMKNLAAEKEAAIVGSLIIEDKGQVYNRAIWVFPSGFVSWYDKRHLFSMGNEHLYYTAGRKRTIIDYKGWRFLPQICYDLRFPVFSRNQNDYDVIFFMANWPAPRHFVWKNLLVARALENQAYCLGTNRVGTDGMGLEYLGDSAIVSPKGQANFLGKSQQATTYTIDYDELQTFRKKFPVLNDRDSFKLSL